MRGMSLFICVVIGINKGHGELDSDPWEEVLAAAPTAELNCSTYGGLLAAAPNCIVASSLGVERLEILEESDQRVADLLEDQKG
ncbi:uncharacterized protein [Oryza sativa Japonica Group]|uniref:uncharacterized protein n=1 Tax=Oryza sativa subsp. japonica TaxID=39947 RepID=UPI00339C32CF